MNLSAGFRSKRRTLDRPEREPGRVTSSSAPYWVPSTSWATHSFCFGVREGRKEPALYWCRSSLSATWGPASSCPLSSCSLHALPRSSKLVFGNLWWNYLRLPQESISVLAKESFFCFPVATNWFGREKQKQKACHVWLWEISFSIMPVPSPGVLMSVTVLTF